MSFARSLGILLFLLFDFDDQVGLSSPVSTATGIAIRLSAVLLLLLLSQLRELFFSVLDDQQGPIKTQVPRRPLHSTVFQAASSYVVKNFSPQVSSAVVVVAAYLLALYILFWDAIHFTNLLGQLA